MTDNLDTSENVMEKYLENINDRSYEEYLDNFKKILEDRKKCMKSKKCIYNFEITKKNIIKKKDDKVIYNIKLPKYILVEDRLAIINNKLNSISDEIKYMQNIITLDSDKKLIDKYKSNRKEFMELEKEHQSLIEYLNKVNKVEEKEKLKIEINTNVRQLEIQRKELYNEIQKMFLQKKTKGFSQENYEKAIEEYLDNGELIKLKKNLRELNEYSLKTDDLFFNIKRNKYCGKINYIVEELPNIKRDTKIRKIVKSVSKKKLVKSK